MGPSTSYSRGERGGKQAGVGSPQNWTVAGGVFWILVVFREMSLIQRIPNTTSSSMPGGRTPMWVVGYFWMFAFKYNETHRQ